jgi:hypothetical protein
MIRDNRCGSCRFHLFMSTLNVLFTCAALAYSGNLLNALGLPFSFFGWFLHYTDNRRHAEIATEPE